MRTRPETAPLGRHSRGKEHADGRLHPPTAFHFRIAPKSPKEAGSGPRIALFFSRYRPEVVSRGPGETAADLHIAAARDLVPDINLRHCRYRHGRPDTDEAQRGQQDANARHAANHFATTLSSTPPVPPAFGTTTILL